MIPDTLREHAPESDDRDVCRSNVVPASNVYVRHGPASAADRDARFRLHVRGKEAIRELLQARPGVVDWSHSLGEQKLPVLDDREEAEARELLRDDPHAEVRFALTRDQEAQLRGLRCTCGRVDFGERRLADGQVRWGYLWQFAARCLCMRRVAAGDREREAGVAVTVRRLLQRRFAERATFFLYPERLWTARQLHLDPEAVPASRGIYAWYFRELPGTFDTGDDTWVNVARWTAAYVGVAGRGEDSGNTLRNRIVNAHLRGSLPSTLRDRLAGFLPPSGDLTQWLHDHAAVSWLIDERPWEIEREALECFGHLLPLNHAGNPAHRPGRGG